MNRQHPVVLAHAPVPDTCRAQGNFDLRMSPLLPKETTASMFTAFDGITDQMQQVRDTIDKHLAESSGRIAVRSLLGTIGNHGGKMLRPGLVLLSGKACGQITDTHVCVAAMFEMIHRATLLHDDVIDEGRQRRGQPTVNNLHGNESAVLLGDFILARVFRMCAGLDHQVVTIIADAAVRTCEGELQQTTGRRNWALSESEYIDIITKKTAAIFSACCRAGALLAGADRQTVSKLADFGLNIGIAFQIGDDLDDIVGEETQAGKTLGSDLAKSKPTLALIHLLSVTDKSKKNALGQLLKSHPGNRNHLVEMLKTSGSLAYTRTQVREYAAKAVSLLETSKQSNAKQALIGVADFVAERGCL